MASARRSKSGSTGFETSQRKRSSRERPPKPLTPLRYQFQRTRGDSALLRARSATALSTTEIPSTDGAVDPSGSFVRKLTDASSPGRYLERAGATVTLRSGLLGKMMVRE